MSLVQVKLTSNLSNNVITDKNSSYDLFPCVWNHVTMSEIHAAKWMRKTMKAPRGSKMSTKGRVWEVPTVTGNKISGKYETSLNAMQGEEK